MRSHCSAAASARAATDRPDPAGPVNSQACVIAPAGAVAARRDRGRCAAAALQHRDRLVLPDQVVPDAHVVTVSDVDGVVAVGSTVGASSSFTAARISAATSSIGRRASTTR